jgi:hypothetical protein
MLDSRATALGLKDRVEKRRVSSRRHSQNVSGGNLLASKYGN